MFVVVLPFVPVIAMTLPLCKLIAKFNFSPYMNVMRFHKYDKLCIDRNAGT